MNEKLDRKIIRKMIIEEAVALKIERDQTKKAYALAKILAEKESKMLQEGYSRQEINEDITKMLGNIASAATGVAGDTLKGAFSGLSQNVEQYIITKILEKLFGGYDPDTFVGSVIANVIENIDVLTITKYVGEGACEPIVEAITKGIVEAISEQGLNKLFGDRSEAGFLAGAFRESFGNALNSTEFVSGIRTAVNSVICNASFLELFSRIKDKLAALLAPLGINLKENYNFDAILEEV